MVDVTLYPVEIPPFPSVTPPILLVPFDATMVPFEKATAPSVAPPFFALNISFVRGFQAITSTSVAFVVVVLARIGATKNPDVFW
jgi:hypothetical protein